MIKIKDYIFNEKEIVSIEPIIDGLRVDLKSKSDYIDIYATVDDIEWNYGQNNIKEDYNKDLNNQLDKLEEENSSLRSRLINAEQKYIELKEQSFSGYYIDRVNKAIEYIEEHSLNFNGESEQDLYIEEVKDLYKILKGEYK